MDTLSANEKLLVWINQDWANPVFDALFTWLSMKGGFSIPLIMGIVLYLGWRYGRPGWIFGLLIIFLTAISDFLGNTLKDIFQHARPCLEHYDLIRTPYGVSTQCASSTSGMPSNHALNFFSVFTFICFYFPRPKVVVASVVIAGLVAISRIYLGDHYPIQVLAGALIGMALGVTFAGLIYKFYPALRFYEIKPHNIHH